MRSSLYNTAINDMEENVNSNMIKFTDDTKLGWIKKKRKSIKYLDGYGQLGDLKGQI